MKTTDLCPVEHIIEGFGTLISERNLRIEKSNRIAPGDPCRGAITKNEDSSLIVFY